MFKHVMIRVIDDNPEPLLLEYAKIKALFDKDPNHGHSLICQIFAHADDPMKFFLTGKVIDPERSKSVARIVENPPTVDLNLSPLAPVFRLVHEEYLHSCGKYPPWETLDDKTQHDAIDGEFMEWLVAHSAGIIDGPHGEKEELIDLINVCCKRWLELERRSR